MSAPTRGKSQPQMGSRRNQGYIVEMRNRLGLTLALVLVGAVMTPGAVSAQSAGVLDIGSATVEIDISTGSELPNLEGGLPASTNLLDDDDDGPPPAQEEDIIADQTDMIF